MPERQPAPPAPEPKPEPVAAKKPKPDNVVELDPMRNLQYFGEVGSGGSVSPMSHNGHAAPWRDGVQQMALGDPNPNRRY